MSDLEESVECDKHGSSHAAFVYQHLVNGTNSGFFCDDISDDPRPDAWRAECDAVMMIDGDWNEDNENFAGITLLCANCYDEVRSRN